MVRVIKQSTLRRSNSVGGACGVGESLGIDL